MKVPINNQVDEIVQTIRERERYFPRLVELGKVTQEEADERMRRLRAARLALEWMSRNESELRKISMRPRNDERNRD